MTWFRFRDKAAAAAVVAPTQPQPMVDAWRESAKPLSLTTIRKKAARKRRVVIRDDVRQFDGSVVVDLGILVLSPHEWPTRSKRRNTSRQLESWQTEGGWYKTKMRAMARDRIRTALRAQLGWRLNENGAVLALHEKVKRIGFVRIAPGRGLAKDNLLESLHYYRDGAFDVCAGYVLDGRRKDGLRWLGDRLDDDQYPGNPGVTYSMMHACGCGSKISCRCERRNEFGFQVIYWFKGEGSHEENTQDGNDE